MVGRELNVDLGERSYPIYIDSRTLITGELLRKHIKCKKALIVTNTLVGPLYLSIVKKSLEATGVEVFEVILPDGEEYKTMGYLMTIIDEAMKSKLDRRSVMIALGGGVIGDMTGFAAAIFQRGIRFVQVPTTLMAMVDSAVGGKTAVNHPLGKNMIGAFYQPEAVIIDTDVLNTLPDRELASGISEIIKYGLIRDAEFFEWLESNMDLLLARDPKVLAESIFKSCKNKAAVVEADEKEGGIRATLNLGHTFGHAIEAGMGYGTWLHGEAVSAGIAMATELSYKQNWISLELKERIIQLLKRARLPTTLTNLHSIADLGEKDYQQRKHNLTPTTFLDLMSMDKKVADGQLSLVLLRGSLGECTITNKFNTKQLNELVSQYCSTD
jgi:3-dehydroquinate synthase